MKMAGSNPGHFFELLVLRRFLPQISLGSLHKLDCYANRHFARKRDSSGAECAWWHTGLANRPGVPMIGAAAATKNTHLRERTSEIEVTPPEVGRISRIQSYGF